MGVGKSGRIQTPFINTSNHTLSVYSIGTLQLNYHVMVTNLYSDGSHMFFHFYLLGPPGCQHCHWANNIYKGGLLPRDCKSLLHGEVEESDIYSTSQWACVIARNTEVWVVSPFLLGCMRLDISVSPYKYSQVQSSKQEATMGDLFR